MGLKISILCMGFVIVLAIFVASLLIGSFIGSFAFGDDQGKKIGASFIIGWAFSSVGFGICLTYLLIQKGFIY